MTSEELANLFADRYHNAPSKLEVVSIHLFGIEYAEQLKGHSIKDICERAEGGLSYVTEVCKGIRLAPFVSLK